MPEDNRSEKATVRRRQRARQQGQVARSRDFMAAVTILTVTVVFLYVSRYWIASWQDFLVRVLDSAAHAEAGVGTAVFSWTAVVVVRIVGPILFLGFVMSILSATAQGGFVFAPAAFTLRFDRLNPATNLMAIFSFAGLTRLLRSLIPGAGIVYIAYSLIHREMPQLGHLAQLASGPILSRIGAVWFELSWKCGLVLLAWSGADYGLQYWNFERGIRMTKQEVKEEHKDLEGNPATRARRRNLRRALLRKILKKEVARATAVITNPTHYAVALEYRPESMPAPVVVAKGRNLIAAHIREIARAHDIPIVENPPLAQALYRMTKVGQSIPPQLYTAVAEILAFLYRAQRKMQTAAAAAGRR